MGIISEGVSYIDLKFRGQPHSIATVIVSGPGYCTLIDPGPTICIDHLEAGLESRGFSIDELTHVLLTHIHLDHAGATGTLVRRNPDLQVLVHERGARHLVDPTRLLNSAARLYGNQLKDLWGDFLPIPESNITALAGGECIALGSRRLEVAYTPGHASHHVSYFDPSSRVAYVGDTAGVTIAGDYVLPPTPPPDINLEAWEASLKQIENWGPESLFITHYGIRTNPKAQLDSLRKNIDRFGAKSRQLLEESGTDDERLESFTIWVRNELRREMGEAQAAIYDLSAPLNLLWLGLARYWSKKGISS